MKRINTLCALLLTVKLIPGTGNLLSSLSGRTNQSGKFLMRFKLWPLAMAIFGMTCSSIAVAETYEYTGVVTLCTLTCDNFAALDLGSTIDATFEINSTANGSFVDSDVVSFLDEVTNPALPLSGPVGDPFTDNPLVLDSTLGVAASNGTSGTTGTANQLNGGQILLEFLAPPFNANGAFIVFDLTTGNGQICLFYVTAGCIPGATEIVKFEGVFSVQCEGTDVFDPVYGCGKSLPSAISVKDGYIKMATTDGDPPFDGDCAETAHNGRMIVDDVNNVLYICTASGWTTFSSEPVP